MRQGLRVRLQILSCLPKLHRSLCDDTRAVRRHINLFVNTHHMRDRNTLDTSLDPGHLVILMTAVPEG